MKHVLFNNNDDTEKLVLQVWYDITHLLNAEMNIFDKKNAMDSESQNTIVNNLLNETKELLSRNNYFPCSYLYMFRSKILDRYEWSFNV